MSRHLRVGEFNMPLGPRHIGSVGFVTVPGPLPSGPEPVGTCFFVTILGGSPPLVFHYAVTAAHVLHDMQGVEYPITGIRHRSRDGRVRDLPALKWYDHPDSGIDVAVADVSNLAPLNDASIDLEGESMRRIPELLPPLGSDVFYVGLFSPADQMGLDGVPMVRSGTLGAIYQQICPIGSSHYFEAHLIDCRSYGGFSGSPVLIQMPLTDEFMTTFPPLAQFSTMERVGTAPYMTLLMGLLIIHYSDGKVMPLASNMGVGIVIPAEQIRSALMRQELVDMRNTEVASYPQHSDAFTENLSAPTRNPATEFDRMTDLTSRLLRVPKSEVDELRQSEQD